MLQRFQSTLTRKDRHTSDPKKRPPWLRLERLEDRSVPTTFTVTNTLDAGPGSLRQAVLDANANPGADEIQFKHAEGTVTLLSQLSVTGDLTVNGPGAYHLTVSGGGTTRVLNVAAGVNVTVKDLTIANGKVVGENGGGIRNAGALTLEKSVVTGSTSVRSGPPGPFGTGGGFGGGVENLGALTLKQSRVSGNTALFGGGVINGNPTTAGTLTARDSQITGNNATSTGGGLWTILGTATLNTSSVSNNTCAGDGAGIRSDVGTTLTITGSTVSGNSASGFGTGGIASGAKMTITDSTIAGNTSAAAGIYLMGFSRGGDVLITHSTIRDNGPSATSGAGVGGIWSYSSNKIRIESSVVHNNKGSSAGGLYGFGNWEVVDSIVNGNTAAFGGGGLYVFGSLAITRSTVSWNTGGTGGVSSFGPTTVTESTVSGNSGVSVGGVSGYQLDLVRSTVSGNTANPGTGSLGVGGVAITNGRIQNSTVSGNTVIADKMQVYHGFYGGDFGDATGGVFVQAGYGGSSALIDNSTIAFNKVTNAPADIRTSGGVAVQRPFTISFTGYYGDTYTFNYSGSASVRNTIIARNTSNIGGPDVTGEFISGGHNLIGVLTADATGFVATDLKGTAASPLDPKLKPLAYNGGLTQTHALGHDSPAFNAGDNMAAPPTDQRGSARIVGGVIDIGAYEAGQEENRQYDDGHRLPPTVAPPLTNPPDGAPSLGVTAVVGGPHSLAWVSPGGRSRFHSLLPTYWFDSYDCAFVGLDT